MAMDDDVKRRLTLRRRRQDLLVWENFTEEEKAACRIGAKQAALGGLAGAGATTTLLALGKAGNAPSYHEHGTTGTPF